MQCIPRSISISVDKSNGERNGCLIIINTLDVVDLLRGKEHVGCRWVFSLKLQPNGTVEWYKVRLVAKATYRHIGLIIRRPLLL